MTGDELGSQRHGRLSRGLHLGLRARIAVVVAGVALVLSGAVSVMTLTVARGTLLDAREDAATRRAVANAQTVGLAVSGQDPGTNLQLTLSSLSDVGKPSVALDGGRTPVSLDPRYPVEDLPDALVDRALEDGEPAIMRYRSGGETLVAVAVPLDEPGAAFFEVSPLDDIESALSSIGLALLIAVVGSTAAAALLGYWASAYTIRPLTRMATAAEAVAEGDLTTRVPWDEYEHDHDLAPLAANFNDMVQTLEERIERDARFASDVSHELRSPLTTLRAGIQVLANNRDEMPERAQKALDLLELDVQRFAQLVEDLLEISRFDAGAVRLELEDVALLPMVRATVASLAAERVPVSHEPGIEDLVIACDRRRLARILANFIDNAEKYADGITNVSIEMEEPDPDDPDREPMVVIAVEDSGPGVPEDQRASVFDRFNRGTQGGSRGTDVGVGLGLALAAEHANLQGGAVWVEDRADGGQGARFVVALPCLDLGDGHDQGDLSAATPETTSNLTLTGEHRAITVADTGGRP
jgi:signal transduction histidine kinase